MRLAVVGSVRFATPGAERWARRLIAATLARHRPAVVISGGAAGVDTWAQQEAEAAGYREADGSLVVHRPQVRRWDGGDRVGFKQRNLLVVDDCTHLLAIRCHASTTYGSGWTADRAEQAGRKVARKIV